MAAYRAGIKTVLIPYDNLPDLDEVDPKVKENVSFVPAKNVETVWRTAIENYGEMPKEKSVGSARCTQRVEPSERGRYKI